MAPRNRNLNPDGMGKPQTFNFATAKKNVPFRTLQNSIRSTTGNTIKPRFDKETVLQAGIATPWKALAMIGARLVRMGFADDALTGVNAAFKVASRAPRGPVASKLTGSVARAAELEVKAVLGGKPSTIRFPSMSTMEASEQYRAFANLLGRYASTLPAASRSSVISSGTVLKNQARLWRNIK